MTKNAPWSSSGKKPVGVILPRPHTPAIATPTITSPMIEMRTSRATMAP